MRRKFKSCFYCPLVILTLTACGLSDDGTDRTDIDLPRIDEALDCAPTPTPFTDQGNTHYKLTLTDPDATCNDGTPGIIYIKPASSPQANNLWIMHLQGGGSCRTPAECTTRWCEVSGRMSSRGTPNSIKSGGIFSTDSRNTAAQANQVFVYYCSSDNFAGRSTGFVVESPEHTAYEVDFNGDAIINAVLDVLEAGAVSDNSQVVLPPLTDASTFILSGSSAGCTAVAFQGERVAQRLSTHDVETRLICDGSLSPLPENLENPETVSALITSRSQSFGERMAMQHLNLDESCLAETEPDEVYLCETAGWVLPNHIKTVPLFINADQTDPLISAAYQSVGLPMDEYAAGVRDALEGAARADTPVPISVYGHRCNVHTALHITDRFLDWAVTLDNEQLTLHDALGRWFLGEHVVAIESAETNSNCQ